MIDFRNKSINLRLKNVSFILVKINTINMMFNVAFVLEFMDGNERKQSVKT